MLLGMSPELFFSQVSVEGFRRLGVYGICVCIISLAKAHRAFWGASNSPDTKKWLQCGSVDPGPVLFSFFPSLFCGGKAAKSLQLMLTFGHIP